MKLIEKLSILSLVLFLSLGIATAGTEKGTAENPLTLSQLAEGIDNFEKKEIVVTGTPDVSSRGPLASTIGGFVFGALVAAGLWANRRTGRLNEQKRILDVLAHTDSLTQLPNRAAFDRFVEAVVPSPENKLGILLCDLNDFKLINDVHGHEAGDDVLRCVADRLRAGVRDEDLVVRWGGDEFLVVLPRIANREHLERVAESLRSAIRRPIGYGDLRLSTSLSIGLAEVESPIFDASVMLAEADLAMYRAKAHGKTVTAANSA